MRRREFTIVLGSAAVMAAVLWPFAGRAQQPDRRRIGVLMGFAESDLDAQSWLAVFR